MTLTLIDISSPSLPKEALVYKEVAEIYNDGNDFLAFRYWDDSNKLILPFSSSKYTDQMMEYSDGFSVYDISAAAITPAFNVTHSTGNSYCMYEKVPPRSFVIQSELITIRDHTAIKSDVESGSFISQLEFDIGFNYTVCDDTWNYDYYEYSYGYDDDGANNATKV